MRKYWNFLKEKAEWAAILLILFLVGFLLCIVKAHAEDYKGPAPGTFDSLGGAYIICDTAEQIADIAVAGEKDHTALEERFKELNALKNSKNEPTCVYISIGIMAFAEHIGLPDTQGPNGLTNAWAVHVGNKLGDWWLLWGQKAPDAV